MQRSSYALTSATLQGLENSGITPDQGAAQRRRTGWTWGGRLGDQHVVVAVHVLTYAPW